MFNYFFEWVYWLMGLIIVGVIILCKWKSRKHGGAYGYEKGNV